MTLYPFFIFYGLLVNLLKQYGYANAYRKWRLVYIPEGHSLKGNNPSEGNKSNDTASNDTATQKYHQIIVDWREFRAALFAREQVMLCMACTTLIFLNKGITIV